MRSWFVVLALGACTQGGSPVHGALSYRYADGTVVPIDLAGTQFQVLVHDGDGFSRYPAMPVTGSADGTFVIADVPDGEFWLATGAPGYSTTFELEPSHEVTQIVDVGGRPTATLATQPTPLQLDIAELAPWSSSDELFVDCWQNGTSAGLSAMAPAPQPAATELQTTIDWSHYPDVAASFDVGTYPRLMDPAAGDEITIERYAVTTRGNLRSSVLTQLVQQPAPAQLDGQPSTVTGTFMDVTPARQLAVDVDAARFVEAVPSDSSRMTWVVSLVGTGPWPGYVSDEYAQGDTSLTLGYGQPSTDAPTLDARFEVTRNIALPAWIGAVDYVLAEERGPVADSFTFMPLAPPASLTLAGTALAGNLTIPAHRALPIAFTTAGPITSARAVVWHFFVQNNVGYSLPAATITGATSELMFPSDVFISGDHYAIEVDVTVDDGAGHTSSAGTLSDAFVVTIQ